MPEPSNLVILLSDNHNRALAGCYGHPQATTPNLDRIAASGARFTNAYSASPLCCPARAAMATGRFPHQTGYWDNAIVYDGRVTSWMRRLRDQAPVAIEQRAAKIAPLLDVHTRRGARQRLAHLLGNAGEERIENGKIGGVHAWRSSLRVPSASASQRQPAGTTVVPVVSVITVGPKTAPVRSPRAKRSGAEIAVVGAPEVIGEGRGEG